MRSPEKKKLGIHSIGGLTDTQGRGVRLQGRNGSIRCKICFRVHFIQLIGDSQSCGLSYRFSEITSMNAPNRS